MSDLELDGVEALAPGEAASGLELRLFGPMEVRIGSRPLPRLRSRKGLWLLALLALRAGRDVERDWLAGTLWPDGDAADARRSLRQCLHDLRLALGPESRRLTSESPRTLRLDVGGAFVDVLAFDTAIARGSAAEGEEGIRDALEAGVGLYRGPLLEDCAEEWVPEERQWREQAYVGALERLAAAATARGEHTVAATTLQRAIGADPFREDLQRALMEAMAEGGSPSSALLVYREFRALLWREMTAEPAEETTALFRRLREETRAGARSRVPPPRAETALSPSPAPGSPHPHPLPLPLTELIGREEEVRDIIACLAHARLVTLTGAGGIGKTRLALQVAQQLADEYADGARFVNLAPLADPERVPDAVRAALGVSEVHEAGDAREETVETLRQYLSSRRLLLVLDNCEHLIDACALLADALLSQCAGLRLLATSRQALGLPGETVWRVPSLALPDPGEGSGVRGQGSGVRGQGPGTDRSVPTPDPRPLTPDPAPSTLNHQLSTIQQYAAVRLFLERALAAQAAFEMTPRNAPAIVEVCRRLDGIPLAIELAAARLQALSIEQIAARLDDRFRLLTGGSRTALPRQQTLRAAIDWSYDLLSEPERMLMRRLTVFAGGWTLEAAEAVCGEGYRVQGIGYRDGPVSASGILNPEPCTLHPDEVLDLLTSLVEKSLVVHEVQGAGVRFRLLETVRQYFMDRWREEGDGDEAATREQHLCYFLAFAEEAEPHLTGTQRVERLDSLETEHDNLRAALNWSLAEGRRQKGEGRNQQAVGTRDDTRLPTAYCLPGTGPTPSAPPSSGAEEGLRLATALRRFWASRGYLTEGRERLAQALASVPDAGASGRGQQGGPAAEPIRTTALDAAGTLAVLQADYGAARSHFEESLAIKRALGDRLGIAHSLNHLAMVAAGQGEYGSARSLYEESLAIRREAGDRLAIADSLNDLGVVAAAQGEYETACSLHAESLSIQRELEDRAGIAQTLNYLGYAHYTQGEYGTARSLYEESLAIRRKLGNRSVIAYSLSHLGMVAYAQGEYEVARALFGESLAIRREYRSRGGIAESLSHLAMVARAQGEYGTARSLCEECLAMQWELGNRAGIAASLEALAALACEGLGPTGADDVAGGADRLPEGEAADSAGAAARLFGAAEALREAIGGPVPPSEQEAYHRAVSRAREALEKEAFAAAWAEGRAMTLDAAVRGALRENTRSNP